VFPGFAAPKIAWVKNNEAETFARITKVLLPKDYLRFWLTGTAITEMSDASGTSWLDVENRDWSNELLEMSGLRCDQVPELVEGTDISGHLSDERGQELNDYRLMPVGFST